MTGHALTYDETVPGRTVPSAFCTCGVRFTERDGSDNIERDHARHVQQEADWDAVEKAVLWCVLDGFADSAHAALRRLRRQLR